MFFFLGVVAGLVYGLTAVGGALLVAPVLVLVGGLTWPAAITMTLCILVVLTTITAGDGIRARLPRPGEVWPAAVSAALLAPAAVWLIGSLGQPEPALYRWALLLGGIAMLASVRLLPVDVLWPRAGLADLRALPSMQPSRTSLAQRLWLAAGGGLCGLLTGVFGAGGSLANLPVIGRYQNDEKGRATASSEMAMLPAVILAASACIWLGRTADWRDTGLAIFGALAGISVARMVALRMPLLVWQGLAGLVAVALAFAIG